MIELYYKLKTNLFTWLGLYYWYNVKLEYKDKRNLSPFSFCSKVGLKDRRDILNERKIKKFAFDERLYKQSKHLLSNGSLHVTDISYLGCFPVKKTNK